MIRTHAGLPNSCSQCGKPISAEMWWATSDDAARAGAGVCDACQAPPVPTPPTARPEPRIDNPVSKQTEPVAPAKPKAKAK